MRLSNWSKAAKGCVLGAALMCAAGVAQAAEKVNVSLFSWPGYGFWSKRIICQRNTQLQSYL